MDNNIKERLKKMGMTKTDNVGGMRRKKKIHRPIISSRLSEEEKNYNKYIDKVNKNSQNVSEDYNDIFNAYTNDWFNDLIHGFKRKDFTDKKINMENLKDTGGDFLKPNFIDTTGLLYQFKKNYRFLKTTFNEKGIRYIINCIDNLGDKIYKKDYIPKENEKNNIENINDYYKKLEIDQGEIPTQEQLKKKFIKLSSKYHPDKHPEEIEKYTQLFQEINEAYKIILKYHYGTTQNHLYK